MLDLGRQGITATFEDFHRVFKVGQRAASPSSVFGKEQGSEITLIIAMADIIQVQVAAWYVRFNDCILRSAPCKMELAKVGITSLRDAQTTGGADAMSWVRFWAYSQNVLDVSLWTIPKRLLATAIRCISNA